MNKEEFSKVMLPLKTVYDSDKFLADRYQIGVWYEVLKDLPIEAVNLAVQKYIATQHFKPVPADIRKLATDMLIAPSMTEGEVWNMVYKAICNATYHAKEEFDALPDSVKRAVGSPDVLREWAVSDIGSIEVIRSNFMKSYRIHSEKVIEQARLPQQLNSMIATATERLQLGETI